MILVVVIFGGKKLPELGRGLGKGLANFRQAVREPDPAAGPRPEPPSTATEKSAAVETETPSAPAGFEENDHSSSRGSNGPEGSR